MLFPRRIRSFSRSRRLLAGAACSFAALGFIACATGGDRPSRRLTEGDGGSGGSGEGGGSSGSGGSGGSTSSAGGSTSSASGSTSSASSSASSASSSASSSSSSSGGGDPALPIFVLRVGEGSVPLTNAATEVFLERRLTDGSFATSGPAILSLPTSAAGKNLPLTLSGIATSEGHLSLSSNGKYVLLAGYDALVGTPLVSSTTSDVVPRVVGRVDAAFAIDTSTSLGLAFSASNVRGAASSNGIALWISGNSATTGGVHYATLGASSTTQILVDPLNTRCVSVAAGQLYATSGAGVFVNVFEVGSGLPMSSGQLAASLPGLPTANASPYSFALLDRAPGVAGVDTLYVADDRGPASGGGIQKWTFNGASWSLSATWSDGTSGVRGLAAAPEGSGVRIVATTTEASANKLITILDDIGSPPNVTVSATAAPNTVFRGVAFEPK